MKTVVRTSTYDTFRVTGWLPVATIGRWEIERFSVSESQSKLSIITHRTFVRPGDYTRLVLGRSSTVMSDTHDEYMDHYELIREATGRVLIHGLGLGCALRSVLSKPDVEHVDVVEREQVVLDLVSPTFLRAFGDERVTFHCADAFEKTWPTGTRWNVVWHDIWTNICTDDLGEHAKLLRSYGRRADWQGAWKHDELLSLKRRGW